MPCVISMVLYLERLQLPVPLLDLLLDIHAYHRILVGSDRWQIFLHHMVHLLVIRFILVCDLPDSFVGVRHFPI